MSDACRKSIEFASALSDQYRLPGWRQREYLKDQHRKRYNKARNLKHSSATCELKQRLRQHEVEMAHLEYIKYSTSIIRKAELTLSLLTKQQPDEPRLENLKYHIAHSHHQIDLIYRRVIEHEQIPHNEKVFWSCFENDKGQTETKLFLSTNPDLKAYEVLLAYSLRWPIEPMFQQLKYEFGC